MAVRDVKELTVYIKGCRVAMDFFEISKSFPAEERYALTSQGRRSSRSDCHTAIDFARDWGYISKDVHTQLTSLNSEVGKMLRSMHEHPEKFLTPNA